MTGTYTEITEVVAPSSAVAGGVVDIEVKIKNISDVAMAIMVGGALDYGVTPWPTITFPDDWDNVDAGATKTFYGYFTMPDSDVTIHAYSYWYGDDGAWHFDDEETKDVGVVAGTINKKELEHDETQETIPVSDIPQNERGLAHIWGRNDTDSYQTLGIGWVVTDPDGQEVERHEDDWASGLVGAGEDREFIGGRFTLDKVGTYRIAITLYMDSSDPVKVDGYEGDLCTVAAAPPPKFSELGVASFSKP